MAALPNHSHSDYATQSWVGDNYLSKSGGTLTGALAINRANATNLIYLQTNGTNAATVGYENRYGAIQQKNKGGAYIVIKDDDSIVASNHVTASKFIGALQGNADSATYAQNANVAQLLTSPFAYEDGNTLNIDTSASDLFTDSYSFSAMMRSDDSLFGKGHYANVWNFSGYQKWGGTQFAVSYDEGSRAAIRTYTQSTSSWSPWYHLAFQHDLANYIPKSDKFIPNNITTSDWPNNQERVATLNFLSYWNGAHTSKGDSNLQYCDRGRFGTIVTKNTGDYAPNTHYHESVNYLNSYACLGNNNIDCHQKSFNTIP